MDDEQLIEAVRRVREHSCLYDVSCMTYRNIDSKENAWKEVSTSLKESDDSNAIFLV